MADRIAYTADRIFTGESWLTNHAIVVDEETIGEVSPIHQTGSSNVRKFAGSFIAPAFIDLQIYGAHKKLLAVYPDANSLSLLNDYCNKGGAAFCLPAVATNEYDVFFKCIDAVRDYWKQNGKGILGLHIEGPWINKAKRGAHIESLIHSPSVKQATELLDYGKDVIKMITLAPEVCSDEVIHLIQSRGIVIAAGHSNATYDQAAKAFGKGIKTVTHLFNAMSPLQHRQPGLAGAALDGNVTASIIPDGHHVDYAAIRIAKKAMKEKLFAITDAVTETNAGHYKHTFAGDKYEADGILSGSALTMNKAAKNLVEKCGIELDEALRMCSHYPAKVMGLQNELGMIAKGYRKAMVVLNDQLDVVELLA